MHIHAKPSVDLNKYHNKEKTLLILFISHVTRVHSTVQYITKNKVHMSPSAHL